MRSWLAPHVDDRRRVLFGCLGRVTGLVVAVPLVAVALRLVLPWLAVRSEGLALVAVGGVGVTTACWGFLQSAHALQALTEWRRGWRVRPVQERRCRYEEFDTAGQVRGFEFEYEALEDRWAPPCRITVPAADAWERVVPEWARGRRAALLERLREWGAHGGWNAPVTFADAPA